MSLFKSLYTLSISVILLALNEASATDYYVNSATGNDANTGTAAAQAFRSIEKINTLKLQAGDRILFAAGMEYRGELKLNEIKGTASQPVYVGRYFAESSLAKSESNSSFLINAKGYANGILIQNSNHIIIRHATIEADGYDSTQPADLTMRVGVKIQATAGKACSYIQLDSLLIRNIYFENKGFKRSPEEVKTENGTQRYGWGIRLIADNPTAQITQVDISHCQIRDVCHTGIKLTGTNKNIHWIRIYNNDIAFTGGPGMQMSEVKNVHVHHNTVDHSGSNNDSRKWGRGSGLWTWSASQVLIENNRFSNANGPGDSAGAHIDYNCDHVVMQYNFSANNAGGFCEILGNNYNCAYRYNISVNDGHRIKGVNGAFQEGKTFWLSGYQGTSKPRKGPVNSYFYNNTIYVDSSIVSRVAIDNTANGILIANNIFCVRGGAQWVLGDQYKADDGAGRLSGPVFFENNLWLSRAAWPADASIQDAAPKFGDPKFKKPGGLRLEDYWPGNVSLVKARGVKIVPLPGDFLGLMHGLNPDKDILGNPVGQSNHMGAIAPK